MVSTIITESTWYPEKKLVVTHISGDVTKEDVERWEASLQEALSKVKDNECFKIFVNLYGFKAIDLEAHKRFRSIVPLRLADYGWKAGYVDLFEEEAKHMKFNNVRGVKCVGAAHAHQDETKIELYETRFSRSNERFFTDADKALAWIESLVVE